MTDLRVKGDVTKSRLLDATEHLIAEKGFDAVSVRDITGLAKANVAAVNYHFGSREGLLAAVLEHRMKPLLEERAALLEALAEEDGVKEVLTAWARPLVGLLGTAGMSETAYCRVMGRSMEVLAAGTFGDAANGVRLLDATLQHAVEKRLPAMIKADISWRLHFAAGALIHLLVHGASLQQDFQLSRAIDQWIECSAQMFAGSDVVLERTRAVAKPASTRRKAKSTPPLRQMAEVVSAVMEADEASITTPAPAAPVEAVREIVSEPAPEAPAKAKKPVQDDSYGELFLF